MTETLLGHLSLEKAFEDARPVHPECRAVVIVPARNEEAALPATLAALRQQRAEDGAPLKPTVYEVLLLLNNCTDRSIEVALRYQAQNPDFRLQVFTCTLPPAEAHVGTARRALMNYACERLEEIAVLDAAILSTDADTLVSQDWVAQNLAEIQRGAEVVGGVIHLLPEDKGSLDAGTRQAYESDREYQRLVARLESLLDPDPADPWPRHLEHFGASLACTPEAYRRAGGMPAVKPLEDVAFIDALRKVGARIRHSPSVQIYTSARLDGRAEVGLSGQLRHWQSQAQHGLPHLVDSAEWLAHRFATLARLRTLNIHPLAEYPRHWHERLSTLVEQGLPIPRFLELLDCNSLIEEMFAALPNRPPRRAEIATVVERLAQMVSQLELAAARQA